MSTRRTIARALAVPLLLTSTMVTAADWPQWRGPSRNGVSDERVWPDAWGKAGPQLAWKASVGVGFSSIAVSEGRAYTAGHAGKSDVISCLDAASGALVWSYPYAAELGDDLHEGGPGATPTVVDERVYTIDKWGVILCLDAASGDLLWKRDLRAEEGVRPNQWGLSGSALAWKDRVIFNAGAAGVALDKKTGKTLWLNGTDTAGYASPLLFQPRAASEPSVLIFAGKALVSVAPEDGVERWRHSWRTGYDNNNADPLIAGDRIFITTYDRGAALLDMSATKVDVRYSKRAINTHMAPPVLVGEHLYGFSGHHARRPDFRCVHLATGEIRWRHRDHAAGSVMLAAGKLLILDGKGELVVATPDPEKFAPLAKAQVLEGRCWTPPALANGRLYVRNSTGDLRCYAFSSAK